MSTDEENQEKRGFKVEDRRRFSESGEVRPEAAPGSPTEHGPADAAPVEDRSAAESRPAAEPSVDLNFSTFVISLSTQALAHLGEIENPIDRSLATDLGAAKQLIDILGILKDKTNGNLDAAEASLLDNMLYDLRLRYVERARRPDQA